MIDASQGLFVWVHPPGCQTLPRLELVLYRSLLRSFTSSFLQPRPQVPFDGFTKASRLFTLCQHTTLPQ